MIPVRGAVEVLFFPPLFTKRQSFDTGYWRKQSLPGLEISSTRNEFIGNLRSWIPRLFAGGPTLVARSVLARKRAKWLQTSINSIFAAVLSTRSEPRVGHLATEHHIAFAVFEQSPPILPNR